MEKAAIELVDAERERAELIKSVAADVAPKDGTKKIGLGLLLGGDEDDVQTFGSVFDLSVGTAFSSEDGAVDPADLAELHALALERNCVLNILG